EISAIDSLVNQAQNLITDIYKDLNSRVKVLNTNVSIVKKLKINMTEVINASVRNSLDYDFITDIKVNKIENSAEMTDINIKEKLLDLL
ncbi:MAG: hypothetical protein MHPSP_002251, partial [Paramarteilia canceri]